jgi:hypothetical protein
MSRLAGLQRTTVQFVYTCEVYTFMMVIFSFSLCDAAQFCLLYFYSLPLKYLSLSNLVEARKMFIFWHWFWHINLMHRGRKIIVKFLVCPYNCSFQILSYNLPRIILYHRGLFFLGLVWQYTSKLRENENLGFFVTVFYIAGRRSITLIASFLFCCLCTQCCGSASFWCRSGSKFPCWWPDPD